MICLVPNRISSILLDGKQHRKGNGKKSHGNFEFEATEYSLNYISIEASLYAVVFYQKIVFHKTTGISNHKRLKVFHMEKML